MEYYLYPYHTFLVGPTKTAHFFVALHKIILTVRLVRLVLFCLSASNYARFR